MYDKYYYNLYLAGPVIPSGDQALFLETFPGFYRVPSVAAETAFVAAERYFLGGQQLVKFSVGRYAQTVGERWTCSECLKNISVIACTLEELKLQFFGGSALY